MPYIARERREPVLREGPQTAGELNFVITDAVMSYVERNGPVNYDLLNEAMGVLESAKQEFYRRMVAPYEEEKCKTNGDVY